MSDTLKVSRTENRVLLGSVGTKIEWLLTTEQARKVAADLMHHAAIVEKSAPPHKRLRLVPRK